MPSTIPSSTGTAASPEDVLKNRVKDAIKAEMLRHASAASGALDAELTKRVEAKPVVKDFKAAELKEGQVWFTELVKVDRKALPKGVEDFPVTILKLDTLPLEVRDFVPEYDENYTMQLDAAAAIAFALEHGERGLITGPTGSGKSSMVKNLCALMNRPQIRVNMTADMESCVLFGSLVVENGGTIWKDGPITESVRYGAVVCIDEWDVTPPEILFGLQWLFEEHGKLYLKEKPGMSKDKFLTPHAEFRIVCLGNTIGQGDDTGKFAGVNVQNSATIDRFQTTVHLGYLDREHERTIIKKACPALSSDFIKKMIQLASLVRAAYEQGNINLTMSPRTLINWGRKTTQHGQPERSLRLAFANKLRDNDARILDEMHSKVFGASFR